MTDNITLQAETRRLRVLLISHFSAEAARRNSRKIATKVSLVFALVLSCFLAAFFVYWMGFRHTGGKFMLVYFGIFIAAPALCVLATYGVFFITYTLSFISQSRITAQVEVDNEVIARRIVSQQSPSFDEYPKVGARIAGAAAWQTQ